ncbi:MAG TPA: type IV pilus modification protein PilV [Telluria sp.]|nr:type IV pilus modification protein PilV [Telluria sp.]
MRRSGGYSLVEVLVAMFVLAVGVLGAAATQAVSMRMRHDSGLMSSAVRLAATLGERMRANPTAAEAYLFEFDAGAGAALAKPPAACFNGTSCTPGQLAAFDIHDMSQTLASSFPGGRIRVCRDLQSWDAGRQSLQWDCTSGAGAPVVVKIGWRERADAGSGDSAEAVRDDAPRVAMPVPEPGT